MKRGYVEMSLAEILHFLGDIKGKENIKKPADLATCEDVFHISAFSKLGHMLSKIYESVDIQLKDGQLYWKHGPKKN